MDRKLNKKNILHQHPFATYGAIRKIALMTSMAETLSNFRGPLIADMTQAGIQVFALAPDYDERTREAVRSFGGEPIDISLDRTGMRPLQDIANMFRLAIQLRILRPDATFGYFIKPVIYGSIAAWMAGVPKRFAMVAGLGYAFTLEGSPGLKRKCLRAIATLLYWCSFQACQKVFFQNKDDVWQFVNGRVLPQAKVALISGSGVDLGKWPHIPPSRGEITFLLMARLLREKGILEYVEAAQLVKKVHPNVRFILLGRTDPNPGGFNEAQVRAWSDARLVEWYGHVDDVRPWLERSSVYVLPSWREGSPRSTQEAMAIGRAIITTDTPGCRDTVEPGENGIRVPVRDAHALAAAMLCFIDEPELIVTMGAASRRMAEERYDVRNINRYILSEIGIVS